MPWVLTIIPSISSRVVVELLHSIVSPLIITRYRFHLSISKTHNFISKECLCSTTVGGSMFHGNDMKDRWILSRRAHYFWLCPSLGACRVHHIYIYTVYIFVAEFPTVSVVPICSSMHTTPPQL